MKRWRCSRSVNLSEFKGNSVYLNSVSQYSFKTTWGLLLQLFTSWWSSIYLTFFDQTFYFEWTLSRILHSIFPISFAPANRLQWREGCQSSVGLLQLLIHHISTSIIQREMGSTFQIYKDTLYMYLLLCTICDQSKPGITPLDLDMPLLD